MKAADALENAESIVADASRGLDVFSRFNASVDWTLWYYGAVASHVNSKLTLDHPLALELDHAVAKMERAADELYGGRDPFTGARHGEAREGPVALVGNNRRRIHGVDQWFRFAPPAKGLGHWRDGRSAKELANAWFREGHVVAPQEVMALLETHELTREFKPSTGFPECQTRLDDRGRGRQHDLVFCGMARRNRAVVCIEAKADEPFGATIRTELERTGTDSAERAASGLRPSRKAERIEELATYVFGRPTGDLSPDLSYQLLHAVAGTVKEAVNRDAAVAVLIVHEFVSDAARLVSREKNHAAFEEFVAALGLSYQAGRLVGPVMLPATDQRPTRAFLSGKGSTEVRG